MAIPEKMKAVILKESYTVAVEDVPTPKIKEAGDVLVKVHLAGLCGMSSLPYQASSLTKQALIYIFIGGQKDP
jgi:threonine dehydrogenase-like Zn-dependent dehydrogenase